MGLKTGLSAMLILLAACSSSTGGASSTDSGGTATPTTQAAARHPISGLAVIPLTITHQGKRLSFKVELAESPDEQEQGLMFRTTMAPDEGMIFPMSPPRPAAFWMKNTVLPLDIIYIGPDRKVLNIAANARPYDETPIYSKGQVSGVLELNGGRAAQLGIAPGDPVEW